MIPLSWNEIRQRAAEFINEWKNKTSAREKADAQTFETEFLRIFGVDRKKTALFEHKVCFEETQTALFDNDADTKIRYGYIDLFWKGHIIIEMKTPGKDLNAAYQQAKTYAFSLPQKEIPKGILTCDFLHFQYYDLEDNAKCYSFSLEELTEHLQLLSHLAGYRNVSFNSFDPVNLEAAERMGRLHDYLRECHYEGHQLEIYLVRLLFCLFADKTDIFEKNTFLNYIENRTAHDGSDLAMHLGLIFDILNKPEQNRLANLDDELKKFPYIDGGLFEERLETAGFNSKTRGMLIDCCKLDWSKISPAIFGSMFQSVMKPGERHDLGAHYTSENNIMKVIQPLFLDALWKEFGKIKSLTSSLREQRFGEFHHKICSLKFLDPACGCGNFLVICYRELRKLEASVLKEMLAHNLGLSIEMLVRVNVNQFYGIEITEFPARIAQTALWLMDHLMNNEILSMFGKYIKRIPLTASAHIEYGNALTLDWNRIVPKEELNYILGNPPFQGARVMNKTQKNEANRIFHRVKNSSNLDYVACWYKKAAEYIQGTNIEVAFVSTNSICQGEQVPILWKMLMHNGSGIKINFAHQTFKWKNEAKGNAAVYCVIIGFSLFDRPVKTLYHYADVSGEPKGSTAANINAYLVDAPDIWIGKRRMPLCHVSAMVFGSMPNDGGHLLLTAEEKTEMLRRDSSIKQLIHPFVGADEFLNSIQRFCIWLQGVPPQMYRKSKPIMERIKKVKQHRESSCRESTRQLARIPGLFGEIRQPKSKYLLFPGVSSERRGYIPIGFLTKRVIASNATLIVPHATLYEFGVLTSLMHMVWMRAVCGRLELRYRYSASVVYNNFPWPDPTAKQKERIEKAAQSVLNVRKEYSGSTLAELYDPLTMPPELVKAHEKLDAAVEAAYRRTFDSDNQRSAYLFELYQQKTGELFKVEKKKTKRLKTNP